MVLAGWLIHTSVGIAGGFGCPRTKRSGWRAVLCPTTFGQIATSTHHARRPGRLWSVAPTQHSCNLTPTQRNVGVPGREYGGGTTCCTFASESATTLPASVRVHLPPPRGASYGIPRPWAIVSSASRMPSGRLANANADEPYGGNPVACKTHLVPQPPAGV